MANYHGFTHSNSWDLGILQNQETSKSFLVYHAPQIIMVVIVLVAVIMMIPGEDAMDSLETFGDDESAFDPIVFGLTTLSSVIGLGITALTIYLIIKWTEEWNKQFS